MRPAAVEIEANAVRQLADAPDVADGHIETAHARDYRQHLERGS